MVGTPKSEFFYIYENRLGPFMVFFENLKDQTNKETSDFIHLIESQFVVVPIIKFDWDEFFEHWNRKIAYHHNNIIIIYEKRIQTIFPYLDKDGIILILRILEKIRLNQIEKFNRERAKDVYGKKRVAPWRCKAGTSYCKNTNFKNGGKYKKLFILNHSKQIFERNKKFDLNLPLPIDPPVASREKIFPLNLKDSNINHNKTNFSNYITLEKVNIFPPFNSTIITPRNDSKNVNLNQQPAQISKFTGIHC